MKSKQDRQKMIVDIVSASRVRNQKVVVDLLRKNGFSVTQASVSRDLEELSISKLNGIYHRHTEPARISALGNIFFALSGENLIVARCSPGMASALAVRLDSMANQEIVGTVAGDDTVFIAVESRRGQTSLLKRLREEFTHGE
jgi:transcriptional regulator of arginine metabolism